MYRFRRSLLIITAFLLALSIFPAACEGSSWDCPGCGRKGNTGNYCGSCAHPAPWLSPAAETPVPNIGPVVFGLDIPLEDFEQAADSLFHQAKTWTKESAPQALDSFPLMPDAVFRLYEKIKADPILLTKKGSQYYLTTSIHDIVSDLSWDTRYITLRYLQNNAWKNMELIREDDHKYSFPLPEGVEIDKVKLSWDYGKHRVRSTDWNETIQIERQILGGKITDDVFVGITLSNDTYSISWYPCFSYYGYNKDTVSIDIYSFDPNQRIWQLDYNIQTGQLIRMYQ